jgi:hypothetical protein
MASAWVYQDDRQVKRHGEEKASWYVGWVDPEGKRRCKSCGPGEEGQRNAAKLRRKIESQLTTGTYQGESAPPGTISARSGKQRLPPSWNSALAS